VVQAFAYPAGYTISNFPNCIQLGGGQITMSMRKPLLFALLCPCIVATACRVPKDQLPGSYYYVSSSGAESPAADLRENGDFTITRPFFSDPNAPGTINIYQASNRPVQLVGYGTWEVLNDTILGSGEEEAVQFTGRNGNYFYVEAMAVKQRDGRICLYTSGNQEYWCKKK
jgi:hypothetical protein